MSWKCNLPILNLFQVHAAAAAAKSLQSCPTLCDPIDGSPPGSPTPGILQARTLEWIAISFSKLLSRVWLLVTPWTAAYQAPPSMGFFRQEYWSGVTLPSLISSIWVFLKFFDMKILTFFYMYTFFVGYVDIHSPPNSPSSRLRHNIEQSSLCSTSVYF